MHVLKRECLKPSYPPEPPSTVDLPPGYAKRPGLRPLRTLTRFEKNLPFPMRDGVIVRADVFRPVQHECVPAIINWGPFGKTGSSPLNLAGTALNAGLPESKLSGYESFEGLDPAEWVPRGYAVVNADARGAGDSEGDLQWGGSIEGQDGYDLVEQIAAQPWCSGRVALAGTSWLALAQWFIASQRPPHLTCIAPLEGISDLLREQLCRGGIPTTAVSKIVSRILPGRQQQEDVNAMLKQYPTRNKYWDDKRVDMNEIRVPTYILGSYSAAVHTLGAFRAFEQIPHDKKWLVIHDTQKWHDLYSTERTNDLAKFFDNYLRDQPNGWEETPPVRLSFLGFNIPNELRTYRELPWTEPGAKKLKLHMNPNRSMSTSYSTDFIEGGILNYQADIPMDLAGVGSGELAFQYTFSEKVILAGPSKVVINVSSEKQDDLDVYVQLRKASADGNLLHYTNMPMPGLGISSPSKAPSLNIPRYLGPTGMLRASMRHVSKELSTPHWQTLSHEKYQPVPRGDIVQLEICIWPAGIIFEPGETLVLKVAGHDMCVLDYKQMRRSVRTRNRGRHFVHIGEGRENYVELNLV
ncbi:Alpha/Beta hydrolase protein [Biscogniauxia sp. FL1348]|nr:Alpha/Beta hydrolase protein [Biscogniauxia sp. FL1348]